MNHGRRPDESLTQTHSQKHIDHVCYNSLKPALHWHGLQLDVNCTSSMQNIMLIDTCIALTDRLYPISGLGF